MLRPPSSTLDKLDRFTELTSDGIPEVAKECIPLGPIVVTFGAINSLSY